MVDLYDHIRLSAVQQRRTVTSFIEEALRAALRDPAQRHVRDA